MPLDLEPAPVGVTLASETDFEGFRVAARQLFARAVEPDRVRWRVAGDPTPELDAGVEPLPSVPAAGGGEPLPVPRVPPAFVELARLALLHADRSRFTLLYRLLWRLNHDPGLHLDALDDEVGLARRMAQAVKRELHKTHAFVRFRTIERAGRRPLHAAWFEPEHHVAEASAGFFMRRFAGIDWALLTPEASVHWDGESLTVGPGASAADAPPPDAGEALWLTYYESIFNPARLKLATMRREMPRRYWPNLPEAALISGLTADADRRCAQMVAREPQPPLRRIPAAPSRPAPARAGPPLPPVVAAGPAQPTEAAMQAQREAAAGCRECPIGAFATQTVWGEGPLEAPLMLVGEQPGDQEDLQGRPFVGPSGHLLDRALAQLGWDRSLLYVTNAVKHFKFEPRGRRRMHKTPAQREADACRHWLDSEIAIVAPRAIVALGATAARQLLGRPVAVTRERGQWLVERADGIPVLVTLHPSALLRGDAAELEVAFAAWRADLAQASRHVVPRP